MRSFDPRRVGRLECDPWVTYYRREWLKFLRAALADAVEHARMPVGVDQVHATFAYSLAPEDGVDPATLFACADERLMLSKRATRAHRAATAQAA